VHLHIKTSTTAFNNVSLHRYPASSRTCSKCHAQGQDKRDAAYPGVTVTSPVYPGVTVTRTVFPGVVVTLTVYLAVMLTIYPDVTVTSSVYPSVTVT
jgi:hypothetical protein